MWAQRKTPSSNCPAMNCPHEAVSTWYDLIRTALEEDAARTVLDSGQIQALMARLKKEKIFSDG